MASGPNTLLLLLRLVLSLGVVLAVVGAAMWALKRRGPLRAGRDGEEGRLELVDRRALSKHAAVAVVRSGSRTFLVGVTEQHVSVLGDWDEHARPAVPVAGRPPVAPAATAGLGAGTPAATPATTPTRALDAAAVAAALGPAPRHARAARPGARHHAHTGAAPGTRRTGSLLAEAPTRPGGAESRMGFVEALREMTVRRS